VAARGWGTNRVRNATKEGCQQKQERICKNQKKKGDRCAEKRGRGRINMVRETEKKTNGECMQKGELCKIKEKKKLEDGRDKGESGCTSRQRTEEKKNRSRRQSTQ